MTPLEYCRSKAAPPASSNYYAVYFADRQRQPALLAVLAYQAELADIAREVKERSVAEVKLNWWRQELGFAFDSKGRHPISQALQQPIKEFGLEKEPFAEIIEAVAMDLEYGSYPSFRELSVYTHRMGTSLTQLMAEVCGYRDKATLRHAHHLGVALLLTRQLRNLRRDADAGHFYIPEDEMAAANVSQADLRQPRMSERVSELLAEQAKRIDDFSYKPRRTYRT
ncbi:hypothetical protein CAI21_14085 [Alkalilimnicola ehrlichii]|uniref:Squalene/phytoene synthase n=1 Tax=Alkalilimnicola ehrlichii TaxID=351052 RepID=A0A3E0WVS4_9GAMM|nr:squalene/phytoene synthase family protein [Alkalilimnicola ehrlichii]RFA27748.1 hypothetical protein CAI21_14085 [Alkalilimnicola ehrlichii]RFA36918.1 hypothetical protein CAL65_10445 [Alkalilimnicola ehrlichii]